MLVRCSTLDTEGFCEGGYHCEHVVLFLFIFIFLFVV